MAENVGGIFYTVSLETGQLIEGQRKVESALQKTSSSLNDFGGRLTSVAGAVAVFAAALVAAAVKSAEMADNLRLLAVRVQVASGSLEGGVDAMARLIAISRDSRTSVAANVDVFNRLNQSLLAMGGTQNDTLRVTERKPSINHALHFGSLT